MRWLCYCLEMAGDNSRLVYSTDGGRVRQPDPPKAQKRQRPPARGPARPVVPNDGVVRVQRDSRGRKGKTATTVTGLPGSEAELEAVLKRLKQVCGAGGSLDGRTLEVQGDHRERIVAILLEMGHKAKLAGG